MIPPVNRATQTRVFLGQIPDGPAGTRVTLELMTKMAREARKSFPVRALAERLVRSLPPKAYYAEINAIQNFVRDNIRYTKDIRGVETVATPEKTLERRVGDCDDMSLLTAALLESLGHRTRFVAIGNSRNNYCHVLVETQASDKRGRMRWVPVETTEPVNVGWYPKGYPFRMVRHV